MSVCFVKEIEATNCFES